MKRSDIMRGSALLSTLIPIIILGLTSFVGTSHVCRCSNRDISISVENKVGPGDSHRQFIVILAASSATSGISSLLQM